jgi:hypothetical protein
MNGISRRVMPGRVSNPPAAHSRDVVVDEASNSVTFHTLLARAVQNCSLEVEFFRILDCMMKKEKLIRDMRKEMFDFRLFCHDQRN